MVILAISDLHGNVRALRRILDRAGDCDVILLAGDLTHFGSASDVEPIIDQCRQKVPNVYAVAGNCDTRQVVDRLDELGVHLAGKGVITEDLGIHGVAGIPHWRPGMYQFTEDELAQVLHEGWEKVKDAARRITLSHVPPRDCAVDRVFWGCHVGSVALRRFVQDCKPDVVICGHIHEARGVAVESRTQIVNCGHGASGYYARIVIGPAASDGLVRIELCEA